MVHVEQQAHQRIAFAKPTMFNTDIGWQAILETGQIQHFGLVQTLTALRAGDVDVLIALDANGAELATVCTIQELGQANFGRRRVLPTCLEEVEQQDGAQDNGDPNDEISADFHVLVRFVCFGLGTRRPLSQWPMDYRNVVTKFGCAMAKGWGGHAKASIWPSSRWAVNNLRQK